MADDSLDRTTERVHLPVASPPRNHGHTLAAWVTVIVIMSGAVTAALAVLFSMPWLFWVGMAIVVVGGVVGYVLKMLGFGQPTSGSGTSRGRGTAAGRTSD
ncbi:HGxxPAAW family protein [Actinotalea sp. Marseille-Q4924]|uniref:HGxxPAAW family protein n=1 Tax=Actinotalea sp. Marseille-Q4924 TaxID=2866571 RepID=UPI001CE4AD55|nr:HGxxPAAW family protein [Actinotalea sp. Marseille-Q4924]